ncbi:MAG TPA: UvrB/UvrC motif-containing protein, partial [Candidatus Binatia bacterium]|nr:UvrB/UvrC motif-containing protein [Candidatus Binatia bacterium]
GRAARHLNGEVILYADVRTHSIQKFLETTEYRRQKQLAHNAAHGITPRSVSRAIEESLSLRPGADKSAAVINEAGGNFDITETIRQLEQEMLETANNLEFEKAALLRDQVRELKRTLTGEAAPAKSVSYKPRRRRRSAKGF